ncbi:hypothetical protein BDD12DRAFT_889584 [Trichophaea hybrida]|nr:hypothetical protein BDD12DRAFT_889584 [Trichophaea hybrida]
MPTIHHLITKPISLSFHYIYSPFLRFLPGNLGLFLDSLLVDLLPPCLIPLLCLYTLYRITKACLSGPETPAIHCFKGFIKCIVATVFFGALALMIMDLSMPVREVAQRFFVLVEVGDSNTKRKEKVAADSTSTTKANHLPLLLRTISTLLLHHTLTHLSTNLPTPLFSLLTTHLTYLSLLLHYQPISIPFLPIISILTTARWWSLHFLSPFLDACVLMSYLGLLVVTGVQAGVIRKPGWMWKSGVVGEAMYAVYVWLWVMAHGVVAGVTVWYGLEVVWGVVKWVGL